MFDPLSRPAAIAEMVALLGLAAFIGWLLSRLVLVSRIRGLRALVTNKQHELADRWQHSAIEQNTASVESVPDTPLFPPTFVHADPLLPAIAPDQAPELISADVPVPLLSALVDKPEEVASVGISGNSESAILSRIAARTNEVNFGRIGQATASEADDLKDIVGIGPFLERKLYTLGIYTFRQIAHFTKEDCQTVNEIIEFFPGRIERDNWVEQAQRLYQRTTDSEQS